jgi:hypothetical protein
MSEEKLAAALQALVGDEDNGTGVVDKSTFSIGC